MAKLKKYKIYRQGKPMGERTAVEIADLLKCTARTVRAYASCGNKLYGEYTFEPFEPEPVCEAAKPWVLSKEQAEEWERMRQQLLHSGLDLSSIPLKPRNEWG